MRKHSLRAVALLYLLAILVGPLTIVFYRTFEHGVSPAWHALSSPETIHAFKLTLIITAIAVPVNTVFGVVCALAIVRRRFPGKGVLNAFIDLPLALSPVVVGLALFLLYGRTGWFGSWFTRHGVQILFALPSMVIATIFVSLPFVAREVVPTLREIGDEQEQAARTRRTPTALPNGRGALVRPPAPSLRGVHSRPWPRRARRHSHASEVTSCSRRVRKRRSGSFVTSSSAASYALAASSWRSRRRRRSARVAWKR